MAQWLVAVAVLAAGSWCLPAAAAGTYTQLYAFTGGSDGAVSSSPLTADAAGNSYGTTREGGDICDEDIYYGCGTIFRTDASGHLNTLYTFQGGADGGAPTAGVILSHGALVGGVFGGTNQAGLLYSIKTDGTGFTVLHEFTGSDGSDPIGLLQPAADGGFFGVTRQGGPAYQSQYSPGNGVLFFVKRDGDYHVAHRFGGSDGRIVNALLTGPSGTLFGSTYEGGNCGNCGTVFEYAPATRTFSVLYAFQGGSNGGGPILGAVGADGTLYGTTINGGAQKHGTLFALTPAGSTFTFATLASFTSRIDGDHPLAGPTLARDGSLIGSTYSYMYRYHTGILSALAVYGSGNVPYLYPLAPLSITRGNVIYGTSYSGGITPCTFSNGEQDPGGCGFIFSYAP